MTTVLSSQDIRRLLDQKPPLVEDLVNQDEQLQTNGFDLTLREVALFQSPGRLGVNNSQRQLSELSPVAFDNLDFVDLSPGPYLVTYNEIVHLPLNLMALALPRSSLLRCGVTINTAVWDAGYSGRAQSLMVVHNPRGFHLQRNARIVQLIFLSLTQATEGYHGAYQRENI